MSLYGLNSGTAAALVLARRSLRFSERLPRVCKALFYLRQWMQINTYGLIGRVSRKWLRVFVGIAFSR